MSATETTPLKGSRAGNERMRCRQGLALAAFAVVAQSPEGALIRAIQGRDVPVNVQLLWCALGKGVVVLCCSALSGEARAISRTPLGWRLAAVAWAQGAVCASVNPYAFMRTTALEAYGIYYAYPVFTAALASIVLHERVRTSTWFALLVALACVVLLVVAPGRALHPTANARVIHKSDGPADAGILIAGLVLAAYLTASKVASTSAGPERSTPMVGLMGVGALSIGFLGFLPLTLGAGYSVIDHMDGLSALWVMLYCVCTGLYFWAMSKAAALWSPTHVAIIALTDAATGPLFSNIFYPEPTTPLRVVATCVLCLAIVVHEVYAAREDVNGTSRAAAPEEHVAPQSAIRNAASA